MESLTQKDHKEPSTSTTKNIQKRKTREKRIRKRPVIKIRFVHDTTAPRIMAMDEYLKASRTNSWDFSSDDEELEKKLCLEIDNTVDIKDKKHKLSTRKKNSLVLGAVSRVRDYNPDGNRRERNAKMKAMNLTKKSLHKLTQSSSVEDEGEKSGDSDEDCNSDNSSFSIDSDASTIVEGNLKSWARLRKKRRSMHKQRIESETSSSDGPQSPNSSMHVPYASIHNELKIRLTPLNNEIVENAKAQGIKVNLAMHDFRQHHISSTSHAKNLCRDHKSVESKELNNLTEVRGHFITDVEDEIQPCANENSAVKNKEELLMQIEPLKKELAKRDNKDSELSARLQAELGAKKSNLDELQQITHQIDSAAKESSTMNPLQSNEQASKEIENSKIHFVNGNTTNEYYKAISKVRDFGLSEKAKKVKEETTTNKPLRKNGEIQGQSTGKIKSLQDISNEVSDEQKGIKTVDVTVEELDKALLNEVSQKGTSSDRLPITSIPGTDKTHISQSPVDDFQSEVRAAEMQIHEIVSRTARVSLTSSNVNLSMAKNILNHLRSNKGYFYVPTIKTEYIQRILLSYFYFVRLKDEESCKQLQGKCM